MIEASISLEPMGQLMQPVVSLLLSVIWILLLLSAPAFFIAYSPIFERKMWRERVEIRKYLENNSTRILWVSMANSYVTSLDDPSDLNVFSILKARHLWLNPASRRGIDLGLFEGESSVNSLTLSLCLMSRREKAKLLDALSLSFVPENIRDGLTTSFKPSIPIPMSLGDYSSN